MPTDREAQPLVAILRECAEAAPQPWYPSAYARHAGIERDSLDPHLERLRLAGLIEIIDWVRGSGQGYRLTAAGVRVLQNARELALLQQGTLPGAPPAPARAGEAAEGKSEVPAPIRRPLPTPGARRELVRAALLEPSAPLVTTLLILANVMVFLWGYLLAQREGLANEYLNGFAVLAWPIQRELGALDGLDVAHGEWWRLLSACFVHFGIIHLAVNMYTLYALGPRVEQLFGRWRYAAIYVIGGLGGSCAAVILHPDARGAGASGALWGLMLAYAGWIYLNRHYRPPINPVWLRNFIVVILINVFVSAMPFISAAGHAGGGAAGLVAAALLNGHCFSGGLTRWLYALGAALVPLACLSALAWAVHVDPAWAQLEYRDFDREIRVDRVALHNGAEPRNIKMLLDTPREQLPRELDVLVHPEKHDPAMRVRAETALARLRSQYAYAANCLADAGPYHDPLVDETRQAALEAARSAGSFFRQLESCLQAGDNRQQQDAVLKQYVKELDGKVLAWRWHWEQFQESWRRLKERG